MTYDLILFDCDGTLVDTEYANNLATIELLHEQGLTQYDMDYAFAHFVGVRFNEILRTITAQTGHIFPDDIRMRYVARARELLPTHMKTIDGALDLVRDAKGKMKICVASNGQHDNVLYSLQLAGLLEHFAPEHIFTGLRVQNPKPAPDLFLLAAQTLETPPARCLVIEDSKGGVTAGVAAGMTTFGFTGAHQGKAAHGAALAALGAHKIYDSLIHIRRDILD